MNTQYVIKSRPRVSIHKVAEAYGRTGGGLGLTLPMLLADGPDNHAVLRRYVDDVTSMLVDNLSSYKDFARSVGPKDAERLRLLLNLIIESREVVEDGKTLK
jgi:hypothetical protein